MRQESPTTTATLSHCLLAGVLFSWSGPWLSQTGQKICVVEPNSDAEYIAPEIVPVHLKAGYNVLVAKCVLGQIPMQYRRVWGAMAKAFYVEE